MVIDSSAIVAIFRQEPEAECFKELIFSSAENYISTVSLFEIHLFTARNFNNKQQKNTEKLYNALNIQPVTFGNMQLEEAKRAYNRFGKGLHPAKLNFGDCAAYALAITKNMPLLFKGNDFNQTDVRQVHYTL